MRWLLDTNVISEIRHPQGDREVKRRISALPSESLFISAIVFGELVKGVRRLPEGERKAALPGWLVHLETGYGSRNSRFSNAKLRNRYCRDPVFPAGRRGSHEERPPPTLPA
jgi:predicted nucleic acid-binding protein